jgi:hypothetical protein
VWSDIRAGLGPARPKEGTTWFRAGLGHCFYTSGWGTSWPKNLLGFAGLNPFGPKHDGLGPGRPGPIPNTTLYGGTNGPWVRVGRSARIDNRSRVPYTYTY